MPSESSTDAVHRATAKKNLPPQYQLLPVRSKLRIEPGDLFWNPTTKTWADATDLGFSVDLFIAVARKKRKAHDAK